MKHLIDDIIMFLCDLYYIKNTFHKKSILRRGRICVRNSNKCFLNHIKIVDSNIVINGTNNLLSISNTKNGIFNCNIEISGKGNSIKILDESSIFNTNLTVRGENCEVVIGKRITINSSTIVCIGLCNSIKIGNDCLFSWNIDIWNSDSHPIFDSDGKVLNPSKPIYIGNHVWLGKGAKILKGVKIEDHSIIGMGTMVTKDVRSNTLVAGNPMRILKENINWENRQIEV